MNEFGKKILSILMTDDPEIEFKIESGIECHRKGFATIHLKYANGQPVSHADIEIRQKNHAFHFGANAFMLDGFPSQTENSAFEELFVDLFNTAVLPFYWRDLEPEEGRLRFAKDSAKISRRPPPELGLEFCAKHHLTAKGHPLCWHDYWPDWVDRNPRRALGRLERRFRELSELCAGRIVEWDVMNEAQTRDFLEKDWMPRFPRGYIEELFRMAAFYFPDALLMYNDDHRWWDHQADYSPVYLLVEKLLGHGCRVDGLGMQFHMFESLFPELPRFFNPDVLYSCFDLYAELNLSLAISEISILGNDVYFGKGEGAVFQQLAAEKLYRIFFSHPAMRSIIWWNIVNDTACSPTEQKFQAGLIERDFTPRPAYLALKHLIQKQWHTETALEYRGGSINKFRGFYGDYDLKIRTDSGVYQRQIRLDRESYNIHTITL